jgi:hypothetical protein
MSISTVPETDGAVCAMPKRAFERGDARSGDDDT